MEGFILGSGYLLAFFLTSFILSKRFDNEDRRLLGYELLIPIYIFTYIFSVVACMIPIVILLAFLDHLGLL